MHCYRLFYGYEPEYSGYVVYYENDFKYYYGVPRAWMYIWNGKYI